MKTFKTLLALAIILSCEILLGQSPSFYDLTFKSDSTTTPYKSSSSNYVFIRSKRGTEPVKPTSSGDSIKSFNITNIVLVFSEASTSDIANREEYNQERWENVMATYPEFFQAKTTYKNICQCTPEAGNPEFKQVQGFYIYYSAQGNTAPKKVEEPVATAEAAKKAEPKKEEPKKEVAKKDNSEKEADVAKKEEVKKAEAEKEKAKKEAELAKKEEADKAKKEAELAKEEERKKEEAKKEEAKLAKEEGRKKESVEKETAKKEAELAKEEERKKQEAKKEEEKLAKEEQRKKEEEKQVTPKEEPKKEAVVAKKEVVSDDGGETDDADAEVKKKPTAPAKPRRAKDPKACRTACYGSGEADLNAYFRDNIVLTKKMKKDAVDLKLQLNVDGTVKKVIILPGGNEELNKLVEEACKNMVWNASVKAGLTIKSEVHMILKYDKDLKGLKANDLMVNPRLGPKCLTCTSDADLFPN